MANNEAGAFLNITPDVLKKLDSFDEKLERIEKHAHTAADALKNGFGNVVMDTAKLENAIMSLTSKIGSLNAAGNAVQGIGISMNQVSKDATKAASSLSSVAQSINKVKPDNSLAKSVEQYQSISSQIEQVSGRQKQLNDIIKSYELIMSRIQSGKGGVIQAGQQQQVKDARQEFEANSQLLAALKQKQQDIVNTNAAYQKQVQLVEKLKSYNQEMNSLPNQRSTRELTDMRVYYSELEKSSARAAKAQENARIKEVKERARATEKAIKDAERKAAADERAAQRAAKAQEYAQRTTPQGALDYSKNTKSLQQNIQAIEYLKKARLSLNTTDVNYKSTLGQINQAIAKHNQALTEAGVKSQQLATRHRNLMDTAGQLSRQLALLFSVSQIEGYIKKLANIRGEFELQQRSLQAILQNKSQADQIFNKTVQLAVKSPFKIRELVSYTKQLAAYRVESGKLYDTTKRLADVSAGLGVDMQRLILAYGQVKAAAYLRGTEVRQFTEAGINLYGELQSYFQEFKGRAYTTAQIVDMISKRKVTFEDIENIFKRLTDSGGLFYNMQEIQSETLIGKIRNLQDSIDIMLNSIGKANEGILKSSIDGVKVIIDNWETIAEVTKVAAEMFVLYKTKALLSASALGKVTLQVYRFQRSLDASRAQAFFTTIRAGLRVTLASLKSIGTLIASNAYLIAFTAVIYAVDKLSSSYSEYNRALEESNKKYNEGIVSVNSLIAKYRELTDEANKARVAQEKNFDFAKNRKDRENVVTQLSEKFKEYGIKEDIGDVSKLTDKELEGTLDRLNKKYLRIQGTIRDFAQVYAETNSRLSNNWFDWSEGISTDAKDLREAGSEFSMYSSRITQMLDIVGVHYFDLSSKVAGYYNQVKKGPDTSKNESEVEWLLRALDALRKINSESKVVRNEFSNNKLTLFDMVNSKKNFDKQKKEFESEVDRLKIELNNKSIKDPILISIALNKLAIDKEWTDLETNIARKRLNATYLSPIEDENSGSGTETYDPKLQRDILAERISLIKEINKEYEKLNKVMGSDKAAKTVMERYASQLKDVKIPKNIIGDAFLPNKENTAKALQELAKIIADFRKKIGAEKEANVLFDEKDAEDLKEQLEKTKENIEAMFNGLDLHKKLKDAGLSEAHIQQLFPGAAKTLDDVQKGIEESYKKSFPKGEYLTTGTDANKQYLADLDKLNKQRIKDSRDLVIELTKNYKTQLSDQLQLDRWYYEERAKIASANLTEEQKSQYEGNLKNQYEKKSDENTWKEFQNSDMYISMFENIESSSTRMLTAMRDKLASLRENLKNLPADQLKAIINQQEKIDEMIAKKNPFSGLTSGLKEYIEFLKKRKELETENIRANNAVSVYTEQKNAQSDIVQQKQLEYDKEVELNGAGSAKALNLKLQLEYEKKQLDIILKNLDAEEDITEETTEQIRNGQKLSKELGQKFSEVGRGFSEFSSALPQIAGNLENVFGTMSDGTKDTIESIAEIAGGLGETASGIGRALSGDVIGGTIQAISGFTKTIGAIFAIGDKKKEREIKRQLENVGKLQKAYEVLKEKMDEAWNSTTLHDTTKQTIGNLNQQINSYRQMIRAEEDKKKTDRKRIEEWQDAIKELEKTKQEILKQEQMDLGGIGGNAEYKSAAENFTQAWMDAFNETGKGIDGLKGSFDDMVENLVVKQATMRLAQGRLKKLFEKIDESVTENSIGGINLTKQELADINSIADGALKGLNEDLLALMDTLGYKGKGKKAELSALTQSTQSLSESTAEELAALLGSVRFFVATQTSDITAIRTLLEARYGMETEYSSNNPMLVELRAQTEYLEILSNRIDRVFSTNQNSKGAGLRVFIQ